jgi:hypothetical protein
MEHQNQGHTAQRQFQSHFGSSWFKSCDSASYIEYENEHDEHKDARVSRAQPLATIAWLASRLDRFLEGNVGVSEKLEQLRV